MKDEKKDQTEAVVLNDLAEDENMDKGTSESQLKDLYYVQIHNTCAELARTNRASRQLRRRSRFIRVSKHVHDTFMRLS